MIVIRRRLIFWLAKAYIKKWGKLILLYFLIGFIAFLFIRVLIKISPSVIPSSGNEAIGMVGSYTINDLPSNILYELSFGLTSFSSDETVRPSVARSWRVSDNGKTYTFFLKHNISFTDGTKLTSKYIDYGFSGVTIIRPDDYTIVFKLKDRYSPFLATVSRPIFKKGFIGVGNYKISNIKLNGDFVVSLDLTSTNSSFRLLRYEFFPTEDALKTAFVLGEVNKIYAISNLKFINTSFLNFKSVVVDKKLSNNQLVTLFFNTKDKILSEKDIRIALSYAIPDSLPGGKRNPGPYPFYSWAYDDISNSHSQDPAHAKSILSQSKGLPAFSKTVLTIKTLPQYIDTANVISQNFKKLGINTKVETVDSIPDTFQIFLGNFSFSEDPDQYILWHSDQVDNITGYKNLRIDKLLEDGRKTIDISQRKSIYSDFQKYLLDDPPALFLYLPYEYDVSRK